MYSSISRKSTIREETRVCLKQTKSLSKLCFQPIHSKILSQQKREN